MTKVMMRANDTTRIKDGYQNKRIVIHGPVAHPAPPLAVVPLRFLFYSTCSPLDCGDYEVYMLYFDLPRPDLENRSFLYFFTTRPFRTVDSRGHLFDFLAKKYAVPPVDQWERHVVPERFRTEETERQMFTDRLESSGFDWTLPVDHSRFDFLIKAPYLGDMDLVGTGEHVGRWQRMLSSGELRVPLEFKRFIMEYKFE